MGHCSFTGEVNICIECKTWKSRLCLNVIYLIKRGRRQHPRLHTQISAGGVTWWQAKDKLRHLKTKDCTYSLYLKTSNIREPTMRNITKSHLAHKDWRTTEQAHCDRFDLHDQAVDGWSCTSPHSPHDGDDHMSNIQPSAVMKGGAVKTLHWSHQFFIFIFSSLSFCLLILRLLNLLYSISDSQEVAVIWMEIWLL